MDIGNIDIRREKYILITCVNIADGGLLVQCVQFQQVIIAWLLLQIFHILGGFVELLQYFAFINKKIMKTKLKICL